MNGTNICVTLDPVTCLNKKKLQLPKLVVLTIQSMVVAMKNLKSTRHAAKHKKDPDGRLHVILVDGGLSMMNKVEYTKLAFEILLYLGAMLAMAYALFRDNI